MLDAPFYAKGKTKLESQMRECDGPLGRESHPIRKALQSGIGRLHACQTHNLTMP